MAFDPLSILILKYRGRSAAVFSDHCPDYNSLVAVARRNFRALQSFPLAYLVPLASIPGHPETSEVEISKEVWPAVRTVVHTVTIALESEMEASAGESEDSAPSKKKKKKKKKKETQASADLECSSTTASPTGSVRPAINGHIPIAPKLPFDLSELRGRKPVIYLYPPSRLSDVIVELHLTSSWSFSAVYPSPQSANPSVANHIGAQSLTWAIEAEPDGTLVEKTTGVEVTYLYWEAIAKSHLVTPDVSRATTPVEDIETFDPSRPSLNPSDSILLPISKIVGYLDVALKALALHTEARTSFITYWLPSLLKHEFVALRFVAQASYEKAAQMRVSPAPDVVTRVFMLFRGVGSDNVGLWAPAAARATAEDGTTFWTKVVGIDAVRASDRTLFRVLEWGGMEVV